MEKSLEHVGVLGMKWGIRRNSDIETRGPRTITRGQHKDEAVLRRLATATSKNPHIERKEADLIMDRAMRESETNLNKALHRYADENDLRSAVKKGYITPPKKNIMEMSTKEIRHHLDSDPKIRQQLSDDFYAGIKRGRIIAGTLLATYAAVKIGTIVMETKMAQNMAASIMNMSLKLPVPP